MRRRDTEGHQQVIALVPVRQQGAVGNLVGTVPAGEVVGVALAPDHAAVVDVGLAVGQPVDIQEASGRELQGGLPGNEAGQQLVAADSSVAGFSIGSRFAPASVRQMR